ncbi:DUF1772 domain-containing protein [Actinosynnema sp. NPDC023658]|uniref:DUF1772 domain-containing protein n=1 Tax=Actinosynnema sp. NPDC023658 TaxID=3155465 RepID=UPI0033E8B0F3
MRRRSLSLIVSTLYTWVAMVAFGGILVETIVIYPNVFHDPPSSLALAVDFFAITGPADLFPPMGALTAVLAVGTVVLLWRIRSARPWALGALASLALGEWLFSVLFFWPRNEIMFTEGIAVHSAEVLRRTAVEFETGHWVRLAMSGVTAVLAFTAHQRFRRAASA